MKTVIFLLLAFTAALLCAADVPYTTGNVAIDEDFSYLARQAKKTVASIPTTITLAGDVTGPTSNTKIRPDFLSNTIPANSYGTYPLSISGIAANSTHAVNADYATTAGSIGSSGLLTVGSLLSTSSVEIGILGANTGSGYLHGILTISPDIIYNDYMTLNEETIFAYSGWGPGMIQFSTYHNSPSYIDVPGQNVGIGIAIPTSKLHVLGDVEIDTGPVYLSNVVPAGVPLCLSTVTLAISWIDTTTWVCQP